MFRALKVFFVVICLVLSIQAVVTTSSDVDNVKESSVTVPGIQLQLPLTLTTPTVVLKGPVVIDNRPSAVRANLRKKEEIEVDLEGI